MERKLCRIVQVDGVVPIPGADAIEAAKLGGWTVVVKKAEFKSGDLAVYFEIDSFLPQGNPAWQFLVDKSSRNFNGVVGHVLRSIKLRGQVSQGLLLPLAIDARLEALGSAGIGADVSDLLGVVKYEAPVPAELAGVARGLFPSRVSKTDQERIQNLASELEQWLQVDDLSWEVTEKLEGSSCTFAWLDDDLHVCSRNVDLMDAPGNSLWQLAREHGIAAEFASLYPGRNLALQGELVGHGVQGNIYGLRDQQFYLFDVYDVDQARYLVPAERLVIAQSMGLVQVPLVEATFRLPPANTMETLLAMADGASALKPDQLREGLVFKAHGQELSFKVVSNKYLLKH